MPKEEDKTTNNDEDEDDDDDEEDDEEDEEEEQTPPERNAKKDDKTANEEEGENGDEEPKENLELEEKLTEGFITVQEENNQGKFVAGKRYYAKFLFKGRFLVFFTSQELKNIPVFYIKVKYILSIEDFYNNNPALVFVEFYDGKRETRILLVIPALKEKEKWVDTITEQKDLHEDDEENEDEDFGRSQLETRYLLAEEYESKFIRYNTFYQT